jgi:hypothetical protein
MCQECPAASIPNSSICSVCEVSEKFVKVKPPVSKKKGGNNA